MSAKLLVLAVVLGAFCYTGCVAPAGEGDEADVSSSQDALTAKAKTAAFEDVDPNMSAAERDAILARFAGIPHQGVREELFESAVLYYDKNIDRIENKRWLSILDFAKHSGKRRFFQLDTQGGPMKSYVVAHGKNSDPNDTGIPRSFSNVNGSLQSSLGFYLTAETYIGSNGRSLRLDGLSSTNSNVRERLVVIHGAEYVDEDRAKQGMSWGCPAFPADLAQGIIDELKLGSLIYASK